MDDRLSMIERCLAGELTDTEHAELAAWLAEHEDHRRLFLAEVDFNRTVRGVLVGEQNELAGHTDEQGRGVFDREELEALLQIEATGRAVTIDANPQPDPAQLSANDEGVLSAHEIASVGGYLLGKALTSKPALLAYAAAIAIAAVVIINPWGGGEEPVDESFATNPSQRTQIEPGLDGPALITPVATLTAQHDAQWGGPASAGLTIGDPLHPGDRLTLTQGIAEITTNDGAVAILEAPATVELVENDNALRLHAGRLVGICQTPSSKGFTVYTRLMDVIDISTTFVVWARQVDSRDATDVTVLDGSVVVRPPAESGKRFEMAILEEGGALRAQVGEDRLAAIEPNWAEFLSAQPVLYQVMLPERGLLIHYGFERGRWDNASRTAASPSVLNADGTPFSSEPAYVDGVVGQSIAFNGSYRLQLDDSLSEVFAGPFTIESWVWLERGGPNTQRIISNGAFNNNGQASAGVGLGVQRDASGAYIPIFTAYGLTDHTANTDLPYNQWVHLAVTVDEQGQVTFYRDGQAIEDVDVRRYRGVSNQPIVSTSPCWIGEAAISVDTPEREYWQGRLDELVVYDRVLQASELERTRMTE